MRALSGVSAVILLLVLLTWLMLRSAGGNEPDYAVTLHAFDDFALAQASLRRDVLLTRAGLLRDYDPLSADVAAMNSAVGKLRMHAQAQHLDLTPVDHLAAMVARQERLTEQFKSGNALLQNSLAYFSLLSTRPGPLGARAPATGALAAAILHLTFDTSPESVRVVDERLAQAPRQAPVARGAAPGADAAQALLAHARLLRDLLPSVDATVKALLAVPSGPPLEAIRQAFALRHAIVEASAQRYQWLLYAASLLLLLALADLGRRLRSRALALRRRAAFEHVIAENSTRLINSPPAETGVRLPAVLGELGRAMGVERAYVVLDETPPRVHAWCATGQYPPGWPEGALAAARLCGAGPDVIVLPKVAAARPGPGRDALLAAGVQAWACAPLFRPGRFVGIMAFDGRRPLDGRFLPAAGLLRLAGDAVANAVERELLERDRVRLMARLERARRMQTVGTLASGVAHNFNNIIAAILGYAELAEEQLPPGAAPARHVEEIRRAAERGHDLIDSILAFGRRSDGPGRPVPMRPLLDETASLLRASLPQGVELAIADIPEDLAALGEAVQLQQVILNLCTNAAQAMAGSGRVEITVERRDLAAPLALSHGELTPGAYVRLAVSDTGPGFDDQVARQLFEPFFTTRSAGTGLGLATVREIVADHEGALNVRSTPGEGSCFEAWLAAAAESHATAPDSAPPLGSGETILVLVNDRTRLLGAEEMLAALGYEPVGFEGPDEALAACRGNPGRFDAVVIASAAPLSDSLGVARRLCAIPPWRPILLATTAAAALRADELAAAGVAEIVSKPLISGELAATLARCLRRRIEQTVRLRQSDRIEPRETAKGER
ncbi:MAG TPA: two-component system VirA-like sensor kinase [Caulobacteraceae bacterium]|nr:two-component system VirA-like sensor kinase [Caulobacteraceae bacterium]